jgi:hypothetical protein
MFDMVIWRLETSRCRTCCAIFTYCCVSSNDLLHFHISWEVVALA